MQADSRVWTPGASSTASISPDSRFARICRALLSWAGGFPCFGVCGSRVSGIAVDGGAPGCDTATLARAFASVVAGGGDRWAAPEPGQDRAVGLADAGVLPAGAG